MLSVLIMFRMITFQSVNWEMSGGRVVRNLDLRGVCCGQSAIMCITLEEYGELHAAQTPSRSFSVQAIQTAVTCDLEGW